MLQLDKNENTNKLKLEIHYNFLQDVSQFKEKIKCVRVSDKDTGLSATAALIWTLSRFPCDNKYFVTTFKTTEEEISLPAVP